MQTCLEHPPPKSQNEGYTFAVRNSLAAHLIVSGFAAW
jgi:hypothetical protein